MIQDFADWLAAQGGGVVDVDLFIGPLPSAPAAAAAIQERPGTAPEEGGGVVLWESPRITVLVRDVDYVPCRSRAETFYRAFLAIANTTIGGALYLSSTVTPPEHVDTDEHRRPILKVTMEARRTLEALP